MALQGSSRNNLISLNNKGNNTLMGLNVMLHTSESNLSIEDLYGEPVVCISVIDESASSQALDDYNKNEGQIAFNPNFSTSAQVIEWDWNNFRTNYPSRPFYLLQPATNGREFVELKVPDGVSTTDPVGSAPDYGLFYSEVNRDNGSVSFASDWFSICGLSTYPANTLVSLFIDTSGSMDLDTVRASYRKFLRDCENNSIVVAGNSQNKGERWAVDHNKRFSKLVDLITIIRTLNQNVPFYSDGIFLEALQNSLVDKKIGNDLQRFPNLYGYMGQKGRNSSAGTISITNPDGTLSINNSFMRGETTGSATKTNWVNSYYGNVNNHTINVCDVTENLPNGGRLTNPDSTGFNSADVHGNIFSLFTTPNTITSQTPGFFGTVLSSRTRRECYTLIITDSKEQLDGPGDLIGDRIQVINSEEINPGLIAERYLGYFGSDVNYEQTAQLDPENFIGPSEPVVCISVIDESNGNQALNNYNDNEGKIASNPNFSTSAEVIEWDWNNFRTKYPDRPFYLLQPLGTNEDGSQGKNNEKSDLLIPASVNDTAPTPGLLYSEVGRGNNDTSSDWFTICGLSTYPPNTLVSLYIDDTGSLGFSSVKNAYNKFIADCNNAGIIVVDQIIAGERWVAPHNKTLEQFGYGTYTNPMILNEINQFFKGTVPQTDINGNSSNFFNNKTWVISGSFRAPQTGSYNFRINPYFGDDQAYFWINRTENFSVSNSSTDDFDKGGVSLALEQGEYYPIRIIYGNDNRLNASDKNPTELTLEWSINNGAYVTDGTGIFFQRFIETELRRINDSGGDVGEPNLRRYRVIALSGYESTDGYDGVLFYGSAYAEPYAYVTFTGTNTNDYTITRSSTAPNWTKKINQKQDTLPIAEQTQGGLFKSSNVFQNGITDYRKPFAEVISQFMEDTLN
jgi:hypothetical protein